MSIQVLQPVPTFGTQLGSVLNQAIGNVAQGLAQRHAKVSDQSILNQFAQMSEQGKSPSPLEAISSYAKLSPETQKSIQPLLSDYIRGEEAQLRAATSTAAKKGGMGEVPEAQKELIRNVLNRWEELQKEGNVGLGSAVKFPFSSKTQKDFAEFNTLRASVESALLPLVNKGTLAKERFNYILSNIPQANDTLATQKGKMEALAREFGIQQKETKEEEKKGFTSLPSVEEAKKAGKTRIRDTKTNKIYELVGNKWQLKK